MDLITPHLAHLPLISTRDSIFSIIIFNTVVSPYMFRLITSELINQNIEYKFVWAPYPTKCFNFNY